MAVRTSILWLAAILVSVGGNQKGAPKFKCGGSLNLQVGKSYTIQSPNFPYPYPNGIYCVWTATAPANTKLRLTCERFSVLPSVKCRVDDFWVFPSGTFTVKDSRHYCGSGIIDTVMKNNKFAAVFFSGYKNYASYYAGFTCTLKVIVKFAIGTAPPQAAQPSSNVACGVKSTSRIVGGQEAAKNEWPWQAGIRYTSIGNIFCGAVLIDKQWAVTAAHCVDRFQVNSMFVSLGDHKRVMDGSTSSRRIIAIAEKIIHEGYSRVSLDKDIALLRLSKPVVFGADIKPICLPCHFTLTSLSGEKGMVTGWGTTSYRGEQSDVLKEVELPILTTSECQKYLGKAVTENMICTLKPGHDSCTGDSGGPLSWAKDSHYYLVGLVSWGRGCGDEGSPGVYTKVTKYLSWIERKTSINFCSQTT
ncbi:trypsin-1-like [Panulirus ornatus]|uniref:trypsin-1-like n=1 Tax=Panulirus ornatus TaxID=150431 RepID=UPI003A8A32A6